MLVHSPPNHPHPTKVFSRPQLNFKRAEDIPVFSSIRTATQWLHSTLLIVWPVVGTPVIKPRRMRWAGHVARMEEERGVYRILVGKLEGKRPLGRTWRGWVDNIRMDLQEVGCGVVDWIGVAQDRQAANNCECCNEPSGSTKRGEFFD
jgi:hypothetical protein